MAEIIIEDLEEMINSLKQYEKLTNKLINQHISRYDIEKFIEDEYIKTLDNKYLDYEYDVGNWIDFEELEEILKFLKKEK